MSDETLPVRQGENLPAQADTSHAAILRVAVETGLQAEAIEKLAALAWRQQDRDAAKEFAEALRGFQDACPTIRKTALAKIATKGGGSYSFNYAPLDQIDRTVRPVLFKFGLSHSWDSEIDERGMMKVTCVLRHVNGHKEKSSFSCPTTSSSGASDAQKHAMALTFAKRQTLTSVLGLTATDDDTDSMDPTPITEEQAAEIRDMISATGTNKAKFLLWLEVGAVSEIRACDYKKAKNGLRAKGESK